MQRERGEVLTEVSHSGLFRQGSKLFGKPLEGCVGAGLIRLVCEIAPDLVEVFGSEWRDDEQTHLALRSLFGEDAKELVTWDAFATFDLGHALFETLIESGFVT